MAETYSVGVTGLRADTQFTTNETLKMPDSGCQGAQDNNPSGLQYAMSVNEPMLCKRNDGSFGWYTLDAERSTPTIPVLKAV